MHGLSLTGGHPHQLLGHAADVDASAARACAHPDAVGIMLRHALHKAHLRAVRGRAARACRPAAATANDQKIVHAAHGYCEGARCSPTRWSRSCREVCTGPGEVTCLLYDMAPASMSSTVRLFADSHASCTHPQPKLQARATGKSSGRAAPVQPSHGGQLGPDSLASGRAASATLRHATTTTAGP